MIVGLTGGIGSGKSTAANLFGSLGVGWVDADIVAREVVEPGTTALGAISERYGDSVLSSQNGLNRAVLRNIIFSDSKEKTWLENLLHPLIRTRLLRQIDSLSSSYKLLVAPLLFENGLDKICDKTIVVDVPLNTQIERVKSRDNLKDKIIKNIIDSQLSREEKIAKADYLLDNSSDEQSFQKQINDIHDILTIESSKY